MEMTFSGFEFRLLITGFRSIASDKSLIYKPGLLWEQDEVDRSLEKFPVETVQTFTGK